MERPRRRPRRRRLVSEPRSSRRTTARSSPSMFAATYPERTLGVILFEASANWLWTAETPWEWTEERFAEQEDSGPPCVRPERPPARTFGSRCRRSPMTASYVEWWYRYLPAVRRHPATPSPVSAEVHAHRTSAPILPSIHVPVLVLYPAGPPGAELAEPSARYLADHIAGATTPRATRVATRTSGPGDQAAVHAGG